MSVRLLTNRIFNHGKFFLNSYFKRNIFTNILENKYRTVPASIPKSSQKNADLIYRTSRNSGIFRFGQHARKLFVDNILNRVTSTYSADLRSKATRRLFYGDSAPFLALIGVSLASGAGILTKEDELEGVCWEIREAASRIQNKWTTEDISSKINENFVIDNLDIGPPIAKGCAAVVYAATFKDLNNIDIINETAELASNKQFEPFRSEMMSPIQNISRFVHNFGGSVDNLHGINVTDNRLIKTERNSDFSNGLNKQSKEQESYGGLTSQINSNADNLLKQLESVATDKASVCKYPLALKMMFNYDIQSNAISILRAMYKETVPSRTQIDNENDWEKIFKNETLTLPPHPNIVLMFGYFCDQVKNFPDGHILYPVAQPPRINPNGIGRNMSLYLLMKRYDYCLRQLLDATELNIRSRILLFAQLLEAVTHINRHGIAHRDLKSDNILIELNDDGSTPLLCISDFGCCLADQVNGLQVPYTSFDIDKGGNAALMAPEIITKNPGTFSVLNYEKSDLWAAGAIAYEIFGEMNPFYKGKNTSALKNFDYSEGNLPDLPDNVPIIVANLIYNLLSNNPSNRLSPDIASNVMQLFLWAPSKWLKSGGMPSSPEILQWLLSLTSKVICEGQQSDKGKQNEIEFKMGRRTYVEYVLISSFLARARLRRIRGALNWIQSFV